MNVFTDFITGGLGDSLLENSMEITYTSLYMKFKKQIRGGWMAQLVRA